MNINSSLTMKPLRRYVFIRDKWSMFWLPVLLLWILMHLAANSAFGQFAGGTGAANDPYQISNTDQLLAYSSNNHQTNYFILINDIDASKMEDGSDVENFEPLGYFNGSFDGQGFTISNLTINRPGTYQVGLFTHSGSSAVFKNINFTNAIITGGNRSGILIGTLAGLIDNISVNGNVTGASLVGGIAGQINSGSIIINSEANVSVTGSGSEIGGLTGYNNSGTISNTTVTGDVNGDNRLGGLTGRNEGNITNSHTDTQLVGNDNEVGGLVGWNNGGTIEDSSASGTITGNNEVGGLVGYNAGLITDSHAESTVNGNIDVGGLVGRNHSSTIENSYSSGEVTGNEMVGGLVGRNLWSSSLINESYSESSVNGNTSVGGLVGFNNQGKISESYATGAVMGDQNVGGLTGENLDGIIETSYSTGITQGLTNVGGLVGLSRGWSGSIIRLSFSTSDVSPKPDGGNENQFGGLVGRLDGSSSIQNSFARGSVTGNNRIGGLVGEINNTNASVSSSYSTGEVTGNPGQSGGLVGRNQDSRENNVNYSFWDIITSGQTSSAGGTSKTTAELLTQSTFTNAGWDFDSIWAMDPTINDGYPYLIPLPPVVITQTYYSRANGNWNVASTWSTDGHGGAAASQAPGANDNAIVGANHTVSLTSAVASNGLITIDNTGTLVTKEFHISGAGTFILAAGGTLHIGSGEGISASGGSGSIKTLGRTFSSQANYVYDGMLAQETGNGLPVEVNDLRIDNSAGVTASANLTGLTVNGQLQLDNGVFTMPPGSSLVANNVDQTNGDIRMQLTIDGAKGWRMITSPVQTDLGDLLDGFVSQGFTGASYSNKQPNILWFDETEIGTTNMAWRAPSGITNEVVGGRGYFHYVFNGAEMSENGNPTGEFYEDTLPITMDATGLEHATGGTAFDFGVTHTPRSESDITDTDIIEMNTGWNLIGNPSTASLDWNAASGWTRTNVDESIYVWDPAANGGEGDFLFWNGSAGTLESGLIAPFQAFWVRANSPNPLLSMTDEVKTTGGTFIGSGFDSKDESVQTSSDIKLKVEADGMESTAFISFSETGKVGEDPRDAYRLESLSESWLKLYTTTLCCQWPLVINHLPNQLEDILHIPIYIHGQRKHAPLGGTYKLSWTMPENWPAHWQAVLMDHEAKKATPINGSAGSISFTVNQTSQGLPAGPVSDNPLNMPQNLVIPAYNPDAGKGRSASGNDVIDLKTTPVNIAPSFSLVIYPGAPPDNIEYMAPEASLLPVYPNPMRDRANIRFNLPDHARVSLDVYDIHGRRIQRLADRQYSPGIHSLTWSPGTISTGIYFVVMQTDDMRTTQKLVVQ